MLIHTRKKGHKSLSKADTALRHLELLSFIFEFLFPYRDRVIPGWLGARNTVLADALAYCVARTVAASVAM